MAIRPDERPAFILSVVGATVLAIVDLVTMAVVLLGLIAVFPFTAALRASPRQTASVAAYCFLLVLGLGATDEIFLDERHLGALALALCGGALAVVFATLRSGRERAARRLAAQHGVAQALIESRTMAVARPRILRAMATSLGFDFGAIWKVGDDGALHSTATWAAESVDAEQFAAATREMTFERGVGIPGRVWTAAAPVWVEDVTTDLNFPRAEAARAAGLHGAVAFPMLTATGFTGVIELYDSQVRTADAELLDVVMTLGAQIAEFVERRRVETERSRLLELERDARIDAGRARDQLEAILQGVADGVTAQGPDGSLVFANEAALTVLGYDSQEELLQAPREQLMARFEIYDEDGEPFDLEALPERRALAGEDPPPATVRFRYRDSGEERWSVVKATPIRDEEGDVVMAINIFEDVTEHKRVELDQRFLAESSRALSESLDARETLEQVVQAAVPEIADWCLVDLVGPDGSVERVAAAHEDPEEAEHARILQERYPPNPDAPRGAGQVIRNGISELYPEIPDELLEEAAVDGEHLELLRRFGLSSAMIVPLSSHGSTFGAMTFVSGRSGRRFDAHSLGLAEEVGRRAGAALENARLYSERSRIAHTLQRSLLPAALPEVPGVEVAARFHPAGEGNEVGGDFYDVFPNGDEWTTVIGDVCGKGPEAAALTGLARHTLRAAAISGEEPRRALELLNDAMLRESTGGRFCTAAYGTLHKRGARVEVDLAVGGHPLPLVLHRDGTVEEAGEHGTLLGVLEELGITAGSVTLSAGEAFVLYTDGVTESRGPGGPLGEEGLREVVASCAGARADEIAGAIETAALEAAGGRTRDDIAVLVLRVDGDGGRGRDGAFGRTAARDSLSAPATRVGTRGENAAEHRRGEQPRRRASQNEEVTVVADRERLELHLEANPEAARIARAQVEQLRDRLERDVLDDLLLLLTELVTNSVRHGSPGPAGVRVRITVAKDRVHLEVTDAGRGFGPVSEAEMSDPASGWGLYLVDRLAEDWGTESNGYETRVWLDLPRR